MITIAEENIRRLTKFNLRIEADSYVPDTVLVSRSWKERLLSFPWAPWVSQKSIPAYRLYILSDGTLVVSPRVKEIIDDMLLENPVSTL